MERSRATSATSIGLVASTRCFRHGARRGRAGRHEVAGEPEAVELSDERDEPLQLTLDDELEDDDLDFGHWVESLPVGVEAA